MSLRWRACNGAFQRGQSTTSDHIWISDDILNRVLRRFLSPRCSQRNGSSVPGPLEAQRRAGKRRMMGLAPVGAGGANLEQGLFGNFGRKRDQQKWQWQAPTVSEPAISPSLQGQ